MNIRNVLSLTLAPHSVWCSAGVVLLLAIAVIVSCAPAQPTTAQPTTAAAVPPIQSKIVLAYGIAPETMDPQMHMNTLTESVLRNIFETLVVRGADMKTLEPGLAESWQFLNDTTLQFKLRKGVKFHNGEVFNAEAVKFTIDRAWNPDQKAPLRSLVAPIKEVKIVDDYTVNVTTEKPDPLLVGRFAGYASNIMPPKYVKEKGDAYIASNPVGTGPYKFVSWVKDGALTLEANPDYWRGSAKIRQVIIRAVPEPAARVAALKTGEADIITGVSPSEIDSINASGKAQTMTVPSGRLMHIMVNALDGPTANIKVRQAINYAVDMESIIKNVLNGNGKRIATTVTPETFGYDPDLKPYPYDPTKAKQLLAEAGYPNGFEITLDSPKGITPLDSEVAQAIGGQLGKVGIKTKVVLNEWALFNSKCNSREIGALSLWSWGTLNFDADGRLRSLFSTASTYPSKVTCRQTYSNKQLDALVQQAIETTDVNKRLDLYKQSQKIIFDDATNIYLYQLMDIYGVNNRLDWKPRPDEQIWLYYVALKSGM